MILPVMISLLVFFLISISAISTVEAAKYFVEIPFGAYNPELNTPAEEWFSPSIITIKAGDEVFWYNGDKESDTKWK